MTKSIISKFALTGAASITALAISIAAAQAQAMEFDIDAQPLSAALLEFNEQAGVIVMVSGDLVEGKSSPAVKGSMEPEDALDKILSGSGLKAADAPNGAYTITLASASLGEGSPQARPFRVAALAQEDDRDVTTIAADDTNTDEDEDVVVVTGTRIKGVKDRFSPITQISRDEMELSGYANVSDILESLPQNFGGGVTPDTTGANTGTGPGGASVNLRGLGNQATLILLNGRRLAAGGDRGGFVDISTIPASAIERVDVLTDGASAVYGSDAIAGVVNIILRDDFDGAETRLNVGTITDGGGDYLKAGQTLGWSGDSAHAMISYEYSVEEELDSSQKDFAENAVEPTFLLPFTQKHSVFTSTGIQVSDGIKLSADAYFNNRKSKQFNSQDTNVTFQAFQETEVQQYGGAVALNIALFENWEADVSGSYSKSDQLNNSIRMNQGLGVIDDAVIEILAFDGSVGGSLFNITDDPVKAVFGLHYRSEKADLQRTLTPSRGVDFELDRSRDVFAAFGEIYAPIISDSNRKPGIENLALSVAARYEEYDDVGSSIDPKVGLAWSPIRDLNIRGTYGTSFRAPRLDQLIDRVDGVFLTLFADPMSPTGDTVALFLGGETDDLDPERSRTWTVGFDFAPEAVNGLLFRGTYFNTVFRDQVGFPSFNFDSDLRIIGYTGIPNRDVSPDVVDDFCSRAVSCISLAAFRPALGDLMFEDVEVILDGRSQNLSQSKVAGFDFEGRYELSSAIGEWTFSLGGTLLTTFEQQVAPVTPTDDLLNTFANPIDLKLRGGVQWRADSVTTALFINHVGDYIDDEVATGSVPIDSFTTMDATIRLSLGELGNSSLTDGAFLSFSVVNMLNEDPPRIGAAPLRAATFDAANSSPTGRRIGLLLTKLF